MGWALGRDPRGQHSRLTDSNKCGVSHWTERLDKQQPFNCCAARFTDLTVIDNRNGKSQWKVLQSENKEEEKGTVRAESEATQQITHLESIGMEWLSLSGLVHCSSCQFGII